MEITGDHRVSYGGRGKGPTASMEEVEEYIGKILLGVSPLLFHRIFHTHF